MTPRHPVVLVHGLWYGRISLRPLSNRLEHHGWATERFGYATVRRSIDANADALLAFLKRRFGRDPVHLVGHSLGGLLALRTLELHPDALAPGRLVLLGSPVNGSAVARRLSRLGPMARLVGRSAGPLEAGVQHAPPGWEVGVVAGSKSVGLGRLISRLDAPHDGTVSVSETHLDGETDHLVLPVTHTGLVLSPTVAEAIDRFLSSGQFHQP